MGTLCIQNGTVVLENRTEQCNILVKDGIIAAISAELMEADRVIDATGQLVFPGAIDTHFHASDPGGARSDWEGFSTGTAALAAGGVTTFVDMPLNNLPATVDKKSAMLKKLCAEGRVYVDFALFGGVVPDNIAMLSQLQEEGVVAYKCFMATCGSDMEGDFKNIDDWALFRAMEHLAKTGELLCIHAENAAVTDGLAQRAKILGQSTVQQYADSRPIWTETEAVNRAILMAKATGCRIHIMHVSNPETAQAIFKAQADGVAVTFESCPHYLVFSHKDFDQKGLLLKCSPPIRDAQSALGMGELLKLGKIPILSSDHSPCPPAMKAFDNAFDAWGGIAGGQHTLEVLYTYCVEQGIPLTTLAKVLAQTPAEIYGLAGKGKIAIGCQGDFAIINPRQSRTITSEELRYQNPQSAYVGNRVSCAVATTILGGTVIYTQADGLTCEPIGQFVRRSS